MMVGWMIFFLASLLPFLVKHIIVFREKPAKKINCLLIFVELIPNIFCEIFAESLKA